MPLVPCGCNHNSLISADQAFLLDFKSGLGNCFAINGFDLFVLFSAQLLLFLIVQEIMK